MGVFPIAERETWWSEDSLKQMIADLKPPEINSSDPQNFQNATPTWELVSIGLDLVNRLSWERSQVTIMPLVLHCSGPMDI